MRKPRIDGPRLLGGMAVLGAMAGNVVALRLAKLG